MRIRVLYIELFLYFFGIIQYIFNFSINNLELYNYNSNVNATPSMEVLYNVIQGANSMILSVTLSGSKYYKNTKCHIMKENKKINGFMDVANCEGNFGRMCFVPCVNHSVRVRYDGSSLRSNFILIKYGSLKKTTSVQRITQRGRVFGFPIRKIIYRI